ncbi:F-box domain-containing protein [Favolaschia claudopus]|uniref:F-box domain-containing protein n=1 Tax=Favolaschia claudopus TaxID=2862362 RepID=A0AAW0D7X0_9AGAR
MENPTLSIRDILREQTERTRLSSRAEIAQYIEDCVSKIASLESQIDALIALRDHERDTIQVLRHITSPIRSLPVELLSEIFDLTIRDQTHIMIKDTFRISQVCSDWRHVAHNTARLWTRPLQVSPWRRSPKSERAYIAGLNTWLARSGTLPISLKLHVDLRTPSDYRSSTRTIRDCAPSADSPIWEEVFKTSCRWHSLDFYVESFYGWGFPAQSCPCYRGLAQYSLDRLEVLKFAPGDDDTVIIHFGPAPRLQTLSLVIEQQPHLPEIILPWIQITTLSLNFLYTTEYVLPIMMKIFGQCPNLTQASVCCTPSIDLPKVEPIVTFHRLRTLSLHSIEGVEEDLHLAPFFDRLCLPALEELVWDNDDNRIEWDEERFSAFQLRSPNISRLEFVNPDPISSDDLRAILRHATNLTHLKIGFINNSWNRATCRALTYKEGVPPLVPLLHHLVILSTEDGDAEDLFVKQNVLWKPLATFLASRHWTDAQLASRAVPPAVARWTHVEIADKVLDLSEDEITWDWM